MPNRDIPFARHLDKNKRLNCNTCHDVHKEDKTQNRLELAGLLWGHLRGRDFCRLCHNQETPQKGWGHETAIPYAHPSGKLSQNAAGSILDRFSAECLSCHDGTISQSPQVQIKQGRWQHGLGMSHPIGIIYSISQDFINPENLPKEIRLFDGKVGCLSCHEIYAKEKNMLALDNKKSRLCLACHKK